MKKKLNKHTARIIVLFVLLAMVITASVATTNARFLTLISSDSSARGAKWYVVVNDVDLFTGQSFKIDIGTTADSDSRIKDGVIAPLSKGSFEINIDCSKGEVAVNWEISIAAADGSTEYPPLNFAIGGQKITVGSGKATGSIARDEENPNNQKTTVTVYWEWPADESTNETHLANKAYSYIATVSVTQA